MYPFKCTSLPLPLLVMHMRLSLSHSLTVVGGTLSHAAALFRLLRVSSHAATLGCWGVSSQMQQLSLDCWGYPLTYSSFLSIAGGILSHAAAPSLPPSLSLGCSHAGPLYLSVVGLFGIFSTCSSLPSFPVVGGILSHSALLFLIISTPLILALPSPKINPPHPYRCPSPSGRNRP